MAKTKTFLKLREQYESIGLHRNPFFQNPLTETELHLWIGRDDEINKVVNKVGEERNVFICGLKGIGKTTMLNYFKNIAKKDKILVTSVYKCGTEERKFFLALLKNLLNDNKILDTENRQSKRLQDMASKVERYEKAPATYSTSTIIEDIYEAIRYYQKSEEFKDFPLMVFVDEFQTVLKSHNTFISILCNMMFERNFIFVCAGLPTYYKDLNRNNEPLDDRFDYTLSLRPLTVKETKDLITVRLKDVLIRKNTKLPFVLCDDDYEKINECSEGNPRTINTISEALLEDYLLKGKINVAKIANKLNLTIEQKLLDKFHPKTQEIFLLMRKNKKPIMLCDLSHMSGYPRTTVHHHLNVLRQHGLIESEGNTINTRYEITI